MEVQKLTGAKLVRLQPKITYPTDYEQLIDIAKTEMRQDVRPALANTTIDLADETLIFVGYPTWWYQQPMIINTFFETYDLQHKAIILFSTSASTPVSEGLPVIKKVVTAAGAKVIDSFTANSKRNIKKFIEARQLDLRHNRALGL